MRLLLALSIVAMPLALGATLAACGDDGPHADACSDLCQTLAMDCQLPGYEGSGSCVANCELELETEPDGDAQLQCYQDAGCSTVELIGCKRLSEMDRL